MSDLQDQSKRYVGIEVSSTALKAVSIDAAGKLYGTHDVQFGDETGTYELLVEFINEIKKKFAGIENIGIAVPGLIDRKSKRVAFSTFIPEHQKNNFFADIQNESGVTLQIENDANAAAYAEFIAGAGRGSRNLFYATLGTGVGGAIILDGSIWHGAAGFAGEFGHLSINSDGMKLEDVASAAKIVARTKNRFHQDDTSSLSKIGESEITLSDIIDAARNEDDFAQMMLERTGYYVGTAIATVINLLNIEKIVIGGAIIEADQIVLDAIVARAGEVSFGPSFESTKIVAGELGKNVAALGAALLTVVE